MGHSPSESNYAHAPFYSGIYDMEYLEYVRKLLSLMPQYGLVAFVALAVAAPACAAPFNPVFAHDTPAADASDDSGAISLKTVGTIGSIAAPLVGGIIDHFTGDQQQRRDSPMDSFQQAMQAQAQGASQQTAAQMAQEQEQMLNAQRGP